MSQFSPELCKLESSNMVYMYIHVCRVGDCFLELRVMTLIHLLFLSILARLDEVQEELL